MLYSLLLGATLGHLIQYLSVLGRVAGVPRRPDVPRAYPIEGGRPLRAYELVYIVQPGLDEEGMDELMQGFDSVVTEGDGEILRSTVMGQRGLAYPIENRTEGQYVLLQATMDGPIMSELERRLKLSEDVLRYLLVRLEED